MVAFTVALVVILILLVYKISIRNHGYWRSRGVESVDALPIVGSLWSALSLQEHMSELFSRLYYEHKGKRFVGYYQGNTPGLLVMDPELIRSIVISDFSHFVDHGFEVDPHNDPMQSRNLVNMSGQQWKEMRTTLSPTFTSGRIKAMFPLVYECADNFEKYLRCHQNQDLDIKDLLARFTTDVIGSCVFGLSVNSLENPNDTFRVMGKKMFDVDFIQGFKITCIFFLPSVARLFRFSIFSQELNNFFRNLVKDIIEKRLQSGNTRKDFMQLLIQLKKGQLSSIDGESQEMNGSASTVQFTDDDIVAQAVVFFVGGFETSATSLSFAMMEIARNPEVQQKARDNIEEVLKRHGGELTYQAIQEMTYLDNILQEALRMYPPFANLTRVCTKNYNIPRTKVFLEKGTLLVIPNRAIQNDPEHFEDPQKFNPDRFNDDCVDKNNKSMFLAFGDGPRQCIGMRFAKLQSKLGLFAILRHFEVLESPKSVYPPVIDPKQFVLAAKDNIYIQLREIQK
ncbi:probable cytochrome P450 6a14 isoform X1 [Cloeon dipterum]|uniref:probable cytochrome P450 6a14 isoform X1 n=1 Tax=Cloeon dipterum TaxID=197152 RepID=UPI00321FE08A